MSRSMLIIGAGVAGCMAADEVRKHPELGLRPVGFVDDDAALCGSERAGLPVLGDRGDIDRIAAKHQVEVLLLAIPSAPGSVIRDLVEVCARVRAEFRVVPGIREIISGDVRWTQIRELRPEDLLGRESVELDPAGAVRHFEGRTVLVTGAGGSIGSELCRWAARSGAARVVLLGHSENELYELDDELRAAFPRVAVSMAMADVRDRIRLERAVADCGPSVVYHAAAHKHVPLMEGHPEEAVKTNVLGTRHVLAAARAAGVERLVMLSTDKAVRPQSVMGASKRLAEMILQDFAARHPGSGLRVAMTRFGNVVGSRGSVVPLFQRQIARGGPVTVSHRDATRYFMTIREAALLVVLAGAQARGGELFVLEMGEPISMLELAERMIAMAGRSGAVPIQFMGLRPGEKLNEELGAEGFGRTDVPGVYLATEPLPEAVTLEATIAELSRAAERGDGAAIRRGIAALVPDFTA